MKILTTGQAAKALHVSIATVVRLIQSGELKGWRNSPTGQYRIKEDDLIEYAVKHGIEMSPIK